MDSSDAQARRREQARERQLRARRARFAAVGSLLAVAVVATALVFAAEGSGPASHPLNTSRKQTKGSASGRASGSHGAAQVGTATVPILAYNVINVSPPGSSAPAGLYVPADEFSAQMDALKAGGWHAVTLNQLEAYWTSGASLGSGKPIVITFDGGYASQSTTALPTLQRLGWVGVENIQVNGLSPSEGGLTDSQLRGLIAAGWELDTEGLDSGDLTVLDSAQLGNQVTAARQTLRSRYGVPVNWFSYPSGRYDATVIAAVRAAGFVGATTLVPGWASPQDDRFRLPRLQVVGGTSASELLSQIASAEGDTPPPTASAGT
jgi:peptidoglycan/xylan/chitin deacetylase (PgdA/CDA1 family)